MSQEDVWGAASSIVFELPVSGQDYYAWLTEAAHNMTIPFRRHYRTQKAKDGRGFWLVEDMWEYGNGRGPLVWVEVAPGSTDELTEFSLTPCSDAISLPGPKEHCRTVRRGAGGPQRLGAVCRGGGGRRLRAGGSRRRPSGSHSECGGP